MSSVHFETQVFKLSPGTVIKQSFELWLMRYGWIFLLPVIACLVGACFRWEWLVVALALCLIIYPFGLMILYFRYGMSDEGILAIKPQKIFFTDSSFTISHYKINEEDGSMREIDHKEIDLCDLKSVNENKKGIILRFKNQPMKFVFIPAEAFPKERDIFTDLMKENGILFV